MRNIIYVVLLLINVYCFAQTSEGTQLDSDTAVAVALERNFAIQKGRVDTAIAWKEFENRWAVLFPNINLSTALTYNVEGDVTTPAGTAYAWGVSPVLNIALNLSVDMIARWRLLTLRYEAQEIGLETLRTTVERDVRKLFYDLLLQKQVVALAEEQLQLSRELFEQTKQGYESGLRDEYSYLRSELQVEQDALALFRQETQYKKFLDNFILLIGLDLDDVVDIEGSLQLDMEKIETILAAEEHVAARSDIRLLQKQLDIQENSKKQQGQRLWPSLSLGYSIRPRFNAPMAELFAEDSWSNTKGTLNLTLSFSLSSLMPFSQVFTARHIAEKNVEKQRLAITESMQNARSAIRVLQQSILSGLELIRTNQSNLELSERARALAQERYDAGLQTIDQLQSSEQTVRRAQLALIQEQTGVLKNMISLVYAINNYEYGMEMF